MKDMIAASILARLRQDHPDAVAEFKFHPVRKWRFDLAIPSSLIAIEIDGGVWTGGRHSGGAGQIKDMEKFNMAAIYGWRVMKYTPQQIPSMYAQVWAAVHRKTDSLEPTDRIKKSSALERRK